MVPFTGSSNFAWCSSMLYMTYDLKFQCRASMGNSERLQRRKGISDFPQLRSHIIIVKFVYDKEDASKLTIKYSQGHLKGIAEDKPCYHVLICLKQSSNM